MAIDYKLISQLEGGQQKKFYTVKGQPNSGVTIATGFDLGSRSPEQLLEAGISSSLVDKMMPYFGKKGKEADKVLANNPVILSEEEEKELDKLDVLAKKQQTAIVVDQLAKEGVDFNSLPSAVQTVIASVGYQESRWRKDAVSYTGVKGIMMLTKDTAREVGVDDRIDPKNSIFGGAKYLRSIYNRIDYELDENEKKWFAIAAYNIGLGHVEDAIKLAAKNGTQINKWSDIEPYILMLSQSEYYRQTKYGYARGWETVKYVQNIKQYYDILVFLDSQDKEVDEKDQEIPKTL